MITKKQRKSSRKRMNARKTQQKSYMKDLGMTSFMLGGGAPIRRSSGRGA